MKDKLGIVMLWWVEVIVSARILLFTVPVLISKNMNRSFSPNRLDDWFIMSLTFIALMYFLIGFASIMGHKKWKFFHYLGAAVVFLLTSGMFFLATQNNAQFNMVQLSPVVVSFVIAIYVAISMKKIAQVAKS